MATAGKIHSWIHHDDQTDPSSLKSQVFRHVAAHRQWKRLQRTRNLRVSALNLYHTFQNQGQQTAQIDAPFVGSYDPFDTLPMPHTAQIDELLQFDQLHVSPAVGSTTIPLHPSATYLQDELAAYGFLARIAAIKARCDPKPEILNLVLKLKTKAMQQLRLSLFQTGLTHLCRPVMSLLYAETWCDDHTAVAVHLRLLEAINNQYGAKPEDLICILHSDTQRATLTLGSPLFTMDDSTWDMLEADYAVYVPLPWLEDDTGDGIQWPWRRLILDLRNALVAISVVRAAETPWAVRQAATVRFLHIMRLLLERYTSSSNDIEKCAALAALYRLRLAAKMERIPLFDTTVFNAGRLILWRLKELLATMSNESPGIRLWVLFVGTMSGDSWFEEEFRGQAETLGLVNSDDVKAVLGVFEGGDLPGIRVDQLISPSC
ncbi:hypothetical protein Z517_06169 [Fonsecaea pedrosoi CBS 271.37]|uniref:Uncharacterized protein n=1 Tax=Fonsecaea pedrosoi CBS 271.37 TaxID=1442368 RepID=A0A0D2EZ31_9EURO|nr:uncharacterized protein Z517_06169 [Fonsecaea pedrosoi CBS 271.37]KIW79557.1 hypothetical protein Z517_06169 [Fonsecaea pedrosoi CBS 271.37]